MNTWMNIARGMLMGICLTASMAWADPLDPVSWSLIQGDDKDQYTRLASVWNTDATKAPVGVYVLTNNQKRATRVRLIPLLNTVNPTTNTFNAGAPQMTYEHVDAAMPGTEYWDNSVFLTKTHEGKILFAACKPRYGASYLETVEFREVTPTGGTTLKHRIALPSSLSFGRFDYALRNNGDIEIVIEGNNGSLVVILLRQGAPSLIPPSLAGQYAFDASLWLNAQLVLYDPTWSGVPKPGHIPSIYGTPFAANLNLPPNTNIRLASNGAVDYIWKEQRDPTTGHVEAVTWSYLTGDGGPATQAAHPSNKVLAASPGGPSYAGLGPYNHVDSHVMVEHAGQQLVLCTGQHYFELVKYHLNPNFTLSNLNSIYTKSLETSWDAWELNAFGQQIPAMAGATLPDPNDATILPDGRLLIIGEYGGYLIFKDPGTGIWTQLDTGGTQNVHSLFPIRRDYATDETEVLAMPHSGTSGPWILTKNGNFQNGFTGSNSWSFVSTVLGPGWSSNYPTTGIPPEARVAWTGTMIPRAGPSATTNAPQMIASLVSGMVVRRYEDIRITVIGKSNNVTLDMGLREPSVNFGSEMARSAWRGGMNLQELSPFSPIVPQQMVLGQPVTFGINATAPGNHYGVVVATLAPALSIPLSFNQLFTFYWSPVTTPYIVLAHGPFTNESPLVQTVGVPPTNSYASTYGNQLRVAVYVFPDPNGAQSNNTASPSFSSGVITIPIVNSP